MGGWRVQLVEWFCLVKVAHCSAWRWGRPTRKQPRDTMGLEYNCTLASHHKMLKLFFFRRIVTSRLTAYLTLTQP